MGESGVCICPGCGCQFSDWRKAELERDCKRRAKPLSYRIQYRAAVWAGRRSPMAARWIRRRAWRDLARKRPPDTGTPPSRTTQN